MINIKEEIKNDIRDIKDKKTLIRLIRACTNVYIYVKLSEHSGKYIKLQKTDLLQILKITDYEVKDEWDYIFRYNSDHNTIYIR